MKNLNLCTDAWLPVRMKTGECATVGLIELFEKASDILDLVLASHERIAIMRLLVCIAQRAINGPNDLDDWEDSKDVFSEQAVDYLQEWSSSFNLLGEDGAFLQAKDITPMEEKDWGDLARLSMESAAGNNPTVFDNAAGTDRAVSLPQLAINLLTFQNFAPCGKIGVVKWRGVPTAQKSPDSVPAGPCCASSAIHLFVCGENLVETIWLNMCTQQSFENYRTGMGKPVWEYMPTHMGDEAAVINATQSYLGRLVPMSRSVKISLSGQHCLLGRGLTYPVYGDDKTLLFYENTMSIKMEKKDGSRKIVGANLNKAMWRSLPALLHRFDSSNKSFALLSENELPERYGIWIGALVFDNAKVLGSMEDYYEHLGRNHVGAEADKVQALLMSFAARGVKLLTDALKDYHISLKDSIKNKKTFYDHATENYWSGLTGYKSLYLLALGSAAKPELFAEKLDEWLACICREAERVFDLMAAHNTVRQLGAWAQTRKKLPTVKSLKR